MTLVTNHDILINRLSCDPVEYAHHLLADKIISSSDNSKMKLPSLTPTEKATLLMSAVRERVESNPSTIHGFLKILLKDESNRDIVKVIEQPLGSLANGQSVYCRILPMPPLSVILPIGIVYMARLVEMGRRVQPVRLVVIL